MLPLASTITTQLAGDGTIKSTRKPNGIRDTSVVVRATGGCPKADPLAAMDKIPRLGLVPELLAREIRPPADQAHLVLTAQVVPTRALRTAGF